MYLQYILTVFWKCIMITVPDLHVTVLRNLKIQSPDVWVTVQPEGLQACNTVVNMCTYSSFISKPCVQNNVQKHVISMPTSGRQQTKSLSIALSWLFPLSQPFNDRWFKSQKHRWATHDSVMVRMNEGARRGWGSRVRETHQSLKSWNWVKGSEKCSLWFALVCLLTVCSELPLCSGQCSWNEGYCLNPPAEHLIKE